MALKKYVLSKNDMRDTWREVFDSMGDELYPDDKGKAILKSQEIEHLNASLKQEYKNPVIGAEIFINEDNESDESVATDDETDQAAGRRKLIMMNQETLIGGLYTTLKRVKDDSGVDMVSVNILIGNEAITLTVEDTGHGNDEATMMGEQKGE